MRPPGRPGSPGRAGGALRERGHGGGDRPIPSRTRQLSPPSPKVLRIRSAGGRDAALAQGASAPIGGRARAGEGPQGPFRISGGPRAFFVTPIRRAFISSLSDNCILGRDAMCIRQRSWGFQTFDALLQRVACFFSCGCREASGDNGLSMLRHGRWWSLGANVAWFPTRCVWKMEAGCAQETKMRILLGGMMRLRRCLWAAVAARFAYFCASAPCRSRYFDIE